MASPKFLGQDELWPTLARLAGICKTPCMVAVPYIGKGAAKLLPLKKGDVLVCALSEANAKSGSICPSEISLLVRRGVRVYVREDLHAKVYLLGSGVVVCSANFSVSSAGHLDEAGVLTRDRKTIKSVREWFKSRTNEPVTPEWLEHCASIYRPPRANPAVRSIGRSRTPSSSVRRVWLVGLHNSEFPESERVDWKAGYVAARARLTKPRRYYIDDIRLTGRSRLRELAKPGDILIQVCSDGYRNRVYPHGRVLEKRHVKAGSKQSVTYLYVELPRRPRTLSASKFRSDCKKIGLSFGKYFVERELLNRIVVDQLLAWLSPERLSS
jgi:PLD-like domain